MLKNRFTLGLDVIQVAHRTECGHGVLEQLLSPQQRQRAQIEILVSDEVESVERGGQLDGGFPNL